MSGDNTLFADDKTLALMHELQCKIVDLEQKVAARDLLIAQIRKSFRQAAAGLIECSGAVIDGMTRSESM